MQYATPTGRTGAPFWAIVAVAALVLLAALTAIGAPESPKPSPDLQAQLRSPTAAPGSDPAPAGKTAPAAAVESRSTQKTGLPFEEEMPPGGVDNLMFSDAEIRYCLAQIIRIDAVRSLVDRYERAQVDHFNGLVADYNNRCGHYRYMEGARESAQALVEPSRRKIESDARDAYLKRFAATDKGTPAKSIPAPAGQSPQPTLQAQSPAAAASPTPPPQTARPVTPTARPEPKQQPPLPMTALPSASPAQTTRPAATAQPQVKPQTAFSPAPVPESRPSQAEHVTATARGPESKQSQSPTPAPPATTAARPASPPVAAAQPDANQLSQSGGARVAAVPAPQTAGSAVAPALPLVKPQTASSPAESRLSPAEHATATAREPESKQAPTPAPPATSTPRPAGPLVAAAQPDAKQLPQSGGARVAAVPAPPQTAGLTAAPAQPDKQQPPSTGAPAASPPGGDRSATKAPEPDAKQQPRPSLVAQPESGSSQGGQAAAVALQSKAKQQPQSPAPPARAAIEGGESPGATTLPATSKPPAAAKTERDSAHNTAVERFASEVQRVASQVLDQRDYPKDAQGKDWQGTTQIEVRYAAAGYIQSIVVGESSGYPPLDDTALQIARNMRLPNAPEELRLRDFAVRFPIVFRLRNP